ncbi:hypothetical protein [Motilimonas pumila]|uniref:Phage abortive infection protein n=1 Tax=Motilimonas pumila TaxID=2303987 RepID=A0A418YA21_9GAMM|nr:hypothetical protein [Motilimonas pumila]RJG38778.1 hypothetical protein D1Z90_18715 [Motilimonas pumila]
MSDNKRYSFTLDESQVTKQRDLINSVVGVVGVICVFIIGTYTVHFGIGFFETSGQWGAFGDFFGGVLNPLIGFGSIILLSFAVAQNQNVIQITTHQLEITKRELAESTKALQGQEALLKQQQFESTFFRLLSKVESCLEVRLSGISLRMEAETLYKNASNVRNSEIIGNINGQEGVRYMQAVGALGEYFKHNCPSGRVNIYKKIALSTIGYEVINTFNQYYDKEGFSSEKNFLISLTSNA